MKVKAIKYLIFLLVLFAFFACERQSLEPPKQGSPYLKFEATFNGEKVIHLAGENACYANIYNSVSGIDSLLTYNFVLDNLNDVTRRYLKLSINNFRVPMKDIGIDKDSTITSGSYNYHYYFAKVGNPRHLKEVSLLWYNSNKESYSTFPSNQKESKFFVKSIKDTIVSLRYVPTKVKIVEIEFNCRLKNSFTGDTINVTNGFIRAIF